MREVTKMAVKKRKKNRRKRLLIKRTIVVLVFSFIILGGMLGVKAMFTPNQAFAGETMEVSSVSGLSNNEAYKIYPSEFNGYYTKTVYLTFDDGPSAYTAQILDILNKYHINGTFFMIGNNLQKTDYNAVVQRVIDEGNYIGVHSMTHNYDTLYTNGKAVEEMIQARQVLNEITGTNPLLVRFPYGTYPGLNETLRDQFATTGLRTWDWTIDTQDWENADTPENLLINVKNQLHRNTEVILMHETKQTVQMLPSIIEYVISQGYTPEVYDENKHFPLNQWNDPRF